MKIVLFGNTNNGPLLIAKGLRAMGHDAVLLVNRKEMLHRPESHSHEFSNGYPPWISDISDISEEDFVAATSRIGSVLNIMADADGLILNHIGPSLLQFVDRPAIVIFAGSDLDYYSSFSSIKARQEGWSEDFIGSPAGRLHARLWTDFVQRQRAGIVASAAVGYFPRGVIPAGDDILDEIGISDKRRFYVQVANLFDLSVTATPKRDKIKIFCGTRLTWKKPMKPGCTSLDYKGSDIMIKGLALFLRKNPGIPVDIRIVRKGLDIEESERLVRDEGIDCHVSWLNEMSLTSFYDELKEADIVFEQLDESCIGMAGLDAMAMGKPVIANGRPEIFTKVFGRPFPVCQAFTSDDVFLHLTRIVNDENERKQAGRESRSFVEEFMSPLYYARKCIEILRPRAARQGLTIQITMADIARAMAIHKQRFGDNITPETQLTVSIS